MQRRAANCSKNRSEGSEEIHNQSKHSTQLILALSVCLAEMKLYELH